MSLAGVGHVAYRLGKYITARACYRKSLAIRWQILGDRYGTAESLEDFAGLAAALGQPERAYRLAEYAARLRREELGALRSSALAHRLEEWLQPADQQLGEHEIQLAKYDGLSMSLEEAITEVSRIGVTEWRHSVHLPSSDTSP